MLHVAILLLFSALAFAQDLQVGCDASSETLKKLEALPSLTDVDSLTFEQRFGPLRKLVRENPHDFFIQKHYIDALRRIWFVAAEYDRALEIYRARNDKLGRYLEARLLMLAEPTKAQQVFTELKKTDPAFVWVQIDDLEWIRLPGRRDPQQAEARIRQFLRVCPESTALLNVDVVQDRALLQQAARRARAALERRNSPLDLARWPLLWTLETRLGLPSEETRSRVRRDLEKLESLPFRGPMEWSRVYNQAAEITGDPQWKARFEARLQKEAPNSTAMRMALEARWQQANPPPQPGAPPEQFTDFQAKLAAARNEWRKKSPDSCVLVQQGLMDAVAHLRSAQQKRSPEEVLEVADKALRCEAASPDISMRMPAIEIGVAEAYVHSKQRLDQVPRLLRLGYQNTLKQEKYRIHPDLTPPDMRARAMAGPAQEEWLSARIEEIQFDYLLAIDDVEAATTLAQNRLAQLIAPTQPAANPELARRRLQAQQGAWNLRLARALEQQGKSTEALAFYRAALQGLPREALEKPRPGSSVPRIKQLYLKQGGKEQEWLEWAGGTSAPVEFQLPEPQFTTKLPQFSAKDLSGRAWKLSSLEGKATLVNFWATWCGPCRAEHVQLQQLFERIKDTPGIQLLTISVDQSPELLAAYIKEKGYTFPVIHDPALADRLLPWGALPVNFLVNSSGMRTSMYHFDRSPNGIELVLTHLRSAVHKKQPGKEQP